MEVIEKVKELENLINEKIIDNNVIVRITGNEEKNKGTIVILKDKKIDRVFHIETVASAQIKIVEKDKIMEHGLWIDNLTIWIYNLYNPIKYLYEFVGGRLNGKILAREEMDKIAIGITENMEKQREKGATTHRKELDNQPIVKEYLGPMFEKIDYGKIYLRYETQEVYNMISK